jgi:transcriptional regulator with XRE-family HTH domain
MLKSTLMTNPDKARARIAELRRGGASIKTIADATGLSVSVLHGIENGYQDLITKDTARKIYKATPAFGSKLPTIGPRRMLQALSLLGYRVRQMATEIEVPFSVLVSLRAGEYQYVNTTYVLAIREYYDKHKDTPAPDCPGARGAITRARQKGWAPPAAWVGRDINDPNVGPGEYDGNQNK